MKRCDVTVSPSRRIVVSIRHVVFVFLLLVSMGPSRNPKKPEAPLTLALLASHLYHNTTTPPQELETATFVSFIFYPVSQNHHVTTLHKPHSVLT